MSIPSQTAPSSLEPADTTLKHEYVRGEHRTKLLDALLNAFDLSSLKQMISVSFGRAPLASITQPAPLGSVVSDLIDWAARSPDVGLHKLLNAAVAANSTNPDLLELQSEWSSIVFDAAPPCPYPGLQEYGIERNGEYYGPDKFFGRNKEVIDAVTILSQHNILMVIGASGSGKSSLVLAGIVPALLQSSVTGSAKPWKAYPMFRPGPEPLTALARAVGCSQQTPDALAACVEAAAVESKVLIVIDQFEETYSLAEKEDRTPLSDNGGVQRRKEKASQQNDFESALLKLGQLVGVYLIIAMRDDFYPDLMRSRLSSRIPKHQRLEVSTLHDAALRDAICRPAHDVGVEVTPDLVTKLVEDGADGPGMLPFLQLALVLLWDKAAAGVLKQADYCSLVGDSQEQSVLVSVMALKADTALAAVKEVAPNRGEQTARRIFVRLVQFSEEGRITRRRQSESSLRSKQDIDGEFSTVLNLLIKHRLLVASGSTSTIERSIELAHDSLIQGWPMLRAWLEEDRRSEQERRIWETRAADWVKSGNSRGDLLSDARLLNAEAWMKSPAAAVVGSSTDLELFIAKSRLAYDDQARREKKQKRNLIVLNILLFAAVVVAIGGWYWAAVSAVEAQRNEQEARVQAQRAEKAQQEAVESKNEAEAQRAAAEHEAERAKLQAQSAEISRQQAVKSKAEAEAQRAAAEHEAERAKLQAQSAEISRQEAVKSKAEAEAQRAAAKKEQRRSDANKWAAMSDLERSLAEPNILKALQYAQSAVLATSDVDGYVTPSADQALRNSVIAAVGDTFGMKLDFAIMSMDFSPSSKYAILVSGSNGAVMLINPYNRSVLKVLQGHSGNVRSAQFSPNARSIVTAGDDKTIRLWDADTGEEVFILLGHSAGVFDAAFSPDGTEIVSASGDGTVRLWDVNTGREIRQFLGHVGSVYSARFSPDGSRLVSSGADGTVRVWEAATGTPIHERQFNSQVNFATFSPDGSMLAAAAGSRFRDDEDFSVLIWTPLDAAAPITLAGHIRAVQAVAFSQDKKRLVTAGDDGTARIWDISSGVQLRQFVISTGFLNDMNFDLLEQRLISVGDDGSISVLEPDVADALAQARITERRIKSRLDGEAEKPGLGYR